MLDDANDLPARNIEAIFCGVEARKNHYVLLSLSKLYQSRSYHNESSAIDWLQSTDHQLAVLDVIFSKGQPFVHVHQIVAGLYLRLRISRRASYQNSNCMLILIFELPEEICERRKSYPNSTHRC